MLGAFNKPTYVWSAPLVPVGIALTTGIVIDRFRQVPTTASVGVTLICMLAWIIFAATPQKWLSLVYLWCSVAGVGAAHHHWQRQIVAASDLSHVAEHEPQPSRLRGVVHSAPIVQPGQPDPLRTLPKRSSTRFVLRVTDRQELPSRAWHEATGFTQVTVIGKTPDVTVGDEIELLGRLALPGVAMNPGEFDYASTLRDQGVTTMVIVLDSEELTLIRRGWPTSFFGCLAILRGWGQQTLTRDLSTQQDVAAALLLGEGAGMTGDAWEKYQRTGVIHVLAISGQHLVVLAGFLWLLARALRLRRRQIAPAIAILLIGYALLTGGRPPVMRAAWVVTAFCGGILLRRPVSHANTFALAWIGVALVNPSDLFNAGCQLSFLAVAVLVWGIGRWTNGPADPLERVLNQARPWYSLLAVGVVRWVIAAYAVNAVVWLAVTPLVAANYHNVSPVALLIGPPMVLLTSLALLAGFGFFLFAGWLSPIAWLFAGVMQGSLLGCDALVTLGQSLPLAYFFVADVPIWWLLGFYAGLLIAITTPLGLRHGRWALVVGGIWLALGVALMAWPHRPGEFRCTFVAVGHGGCTVIETPQGRVIVYDAGATAGPDVTRRHIAPFLWSRGIHRIDDLILSHADLDHFNGIPQLVDRFAIGRVICTPTFAERSLQAVRITVAALEQRGIPIQVVQRGDQWDADGVAFEVLHPPEVGPEGKENVRSLVLRIRHANFSMLLTGDLEEEGLKQVLALPAQRTDLLMAPHHGSDKSNIPKLAAWAQPKLVVSSQAQPISQRVSVRMYEKLGAQYLGTWPHGAITIRPGDAEAPVMTYRSKKVLRPF